MCAVGLRLNKQAISRHLVMVPQDNNYRVLPTFQKGNAERMHGRIFIKTIYLIKIRRKDFTNKK